MELNHIHIHTYIYMYRSQVSDIYSIGARAFGYLREPDRLSTRHLTNVSQLLLKGYAWMQCTHLLETCDLNVLLYSLCRQVYTYVRTHS